MSTHTHSTVGGTAYIHDCHESVDKMIGENLSEDALIAVHTAIDEAGRCSEQLQETARTVVQKCYRDGIGCSTTTTPFKCILISTSDRLTFLLQPGTIKVTIHPPTTPYAPDNTAIDEARRCSEQLQETARIVALKCHRDGIRCSTTTTPFKCNLIPTDRLTFFLQPGTIKVTIHPPTTPYAPDDE